MPLSKKQENFLTLLRLLAFKQVTSPFKVDYFKIYGRSHEGRIRL